MLYCYILQGKENHFNWNMQELNIVEEERPFKAKERIFKNIDCFIIPCYG